jgi:hypothetical protein
MIEASALSLSFSTTAPVMVMLRAVIRQAVVSATAEKHATKAEQRRKQIDEAKCKEAMPASDSVGRFHQPRL